MKKVLKVLQQIKRKGCKLFQEIKQFCLLPLKYTFYEYCQGVVVLSLPKNACSVCAFEREEYIKLLSLKGWTAARGEHLDKVKEKCCNIWANEKQWIWQEVY